MYPLSVGLLLIVKVFVFCYHPCHFNLIRGCYCVCVWWHTCNFGTPLDYGPLLKIYCLFMICVGWFLSLLLHLCL